MASKRRRSSSRSSSAPNKGAGQRTRSSSEKQTQEKPAAKQKPVKEIQSTSPLMRQSEKDSIGDILRRVREHRGEELSDIADYLRIRPGFLRALEESHYEQLPADAYVVGFLRSYAAYLGLDGKGAVNQYRREMSGHRKAPQLSMPQPMSEGRIPTTAILVAAVVFCVLIYGLWYGLSSPDKTIITAPIPVPTEEVAPEGTSEPEKLLEEEKQEEEKTEELSPAGEALSASPAGDLLLHTTTAAVRALSSLEQSKDGATTSLTSTILANETQAGISLEGAAPEEKEEPKEEKQIEKPKPKRYGAAGQTRRIIRASEKSWVLITDENGNTRFDRTLQPGQSVYIPDGKKRFLTTGHAAGIEILLDGNALPKIHSSSQVLRDIDLDPDELPEWIEEHNEDMTD